MENIQVTINAAVLQAEANNAANQAYLDEIKKYYTGHNSPFREAIREHLNKQGFHLFMKLPDVMAIINEEIERHCIEVANTAVAASYLPLINDMLCDIDRKKIYFSEIVEELKQLAKDENENINAIYCVAEKDTKWGWYNVKMDLKDITFIQDAKYQFTLHQDTSPVDFKKMDQYKLYSLPYDKHYQQTMTITFEGKKIEMPFQKSVLQDKFMRFLTGLVLGQVTIYMDDYDTEIEMENEN
jgi:hypothetical protein